ncbi:MAG: hypothetical protein WKF87_14285 [Chryseolinea sp.]
MKLKLLQIRTDMLLRKKTARDNVPYQSSRQIGVIFTVEDKAKHESVKEFIRKFEADGKQVKVIEYLPFDKQNYEFKFDFFTDNDLSFWGNITSNDALKFVDIPFDYLFYLDTDPNPLMLHLLARSKAKCRVGRQWENGHSYFEFMLESVANINTLLEIMRRYVIQLR